MQDSKPVRRRVRPNAHGLAAAAVICWTVPAWSEPPEAEARATDTSPPASSSPDDRSPEAGAAAPADGPPAPVPPDLVRLKDGGMIRGVIEEYLRDEHVVIRTASGKRLTFPAERVLYAGPAERDPLLGEREASELAGERAAPASPPAAAPSSPAPAAPRAPVPTAPAMARVAVEAREPGLALYGTLRDGVHPTVRARLCEAPCRLELLPGSYELFVGRGDDRPRPAGSLRLEPGAQALVAAYESRRSLRHWVGFSGVAVAAIGAALVTVSLTAREDETVKPLFFAGLGTLGAGLTLTFVGFSFQDRAHVQLAPAPSAAD